jgi:sialic acid synthase
MREITIDGIRIADDEPAYIVAEISANHGGDVAKARAMVRTAQANGASAVKFQTRTPREVYSPAMFSARFDSPHAMAESYGPHREALEPTETEWGELFTYCRKLGITAFSTPFDGRSADQLRNLDVPAFKIASGDITNTILIRQVARFGRPVILSTGGSTMDDVQRAYAVASEYTDQVALMQCSCIYPSPADILNLRAIEHYRTSFPETAIGLSCHYPDWTPGIAAYTLGARLFEFHYTNDRSWKGTDNAFSLTPSMLGDFRRALDTTREALGSRDKFPDHRELAPAEERRKKLLWKTSLPAGHVVTMADLIPMCPGNGIPPYHASRLVGETLAHDVSRYADCEWLDVKAAVGV